MKRTLYLIIFCVFSTLALAQHTFQGTSLSEALMVLDQSSKHYNISFVYNELEDFTVTKTIKRGRALPDAVREVCGFYPVRVSVKGHDINVECLQKDRTKLMGRLIGPDRQPVAYANIILYNSADSVIMDGGVSNEAGDFVIPCSAAQARVRISCVGFKTIEREMPVSNVGTIRMQIENNYLGNVTVSGRLPVIRSEADRLQYIVSNDEFARGLNAQELLSRVPMVSMAGGRAMILGKGPAHFMLNGHITDIGNEAIQQKLWTIRSEDIERIEVISNPSGREMTEMGGSYINIVMRRDQTLGWRSDLSMQAGTSDKWSGRADASVNYASEQFDVALDINGNWLTKKEEKILHQSFSLVERKISGDKEMEDKDLGAHLMLRYLPMKNLEVGAFASYQQLWPTSHKISNTLLYNSFYISENKSYSSLESEMKYAGNHVLNLSAYVDWTLGRPDRKLSASYNLYKKQDDNTNQLRDYFWDNKGSYRIHSARLDLSMPLPASFALNAGVSYTNINNETHTNQVKNYEWVDDFRKNTNKGLYSQWYFYQHEEKITSGYLSVQKNFSKNTKAVAGLRYEHTKTTNVNRQEDITNNYFFPSLSFFSSSDNGGQFGITWAMSVIRPNFYDLNPIIDYDTNFSRSQGNPYLTPSFDNRVELNYSNNKGFYMNIYYTHGKDQIEWVTVSKWMGYTNEASPMNNYKSDKAGIYLNYQHQFGHRVHAVAEGDLYYYDARKYSDIYLWYGLGPGYYNTTMYIMPGVPKDLHGIGKRFSVSGDIFLNRQHSLMLNARYDQWLDDYVGLSKIDAYGYFTFALRYALLNDRLKLSLTAVDPFHQHIMDKNSDYTNSDHFLKVHTNLHSHYIGLTATYSLGGKKVRVIDHDFTDFEQQRAEKQK